MMIHRISGTVAAVIAFSVLAGSPAEAHSLTEPNGGFVSGLGHPLGGIDHILAMAAVGLWAAHLGGWARWLVPGSFLSVMAVAGSAGLAGMAIPHAETGIALSVVALGALIAARVRPPLAAGMAVVAGFAFFHGIVHGVEAPAAAGSGYALGFLTATGMLHALGLGLGRAPVHLARIGGGAVAAAGIALMAV